MNCHRYTNLKTKIGVLLMGVVASAASFAQTMPSDVDLSAAETFAGIAAGACVAATLVFAIARWGKRAAQLANPG